MPAATDLKLFHAANRPEDDASTVGGAIDKTAKITNLVLAASDQVEIVSDQAGDNAVITVTGRNDAGSIVSEGPTALNGTTPVVLGTTVFQRILKVVIGAGTRTGTVTIRRDSDAGDICTMEPSGTDPAASDTDVDVVHRNFYDSASEGAGTTRWEKICALNDHATETLLSATIELSADPSANCRIALETAVDAETQAANRETTPTPIGTITDDATAIGVPGGELAAGEYIGVWIEYDLAADEAAVESTYEIEIAGTTAA